MPKTGVLLLRLEGPMQAWGERARWDVRDTADRPTKSGVLGLLGCALGYKRGDKRLVHLHESLRFGVRVDRIGQRMVDFQTVTGDLPSADGKSKGTGAGDYTILSPRAYLQDASFLAGLEGQLDLLQDCRQALEKPRWPGFLGRKSCPPTVPLLQDFLAEARLEDALRQAHLPRRTPELGVKLSLYCETSQGDQEIRDKWLGTPSREYGANKYTFCLVDQPKEAARVS